MTNPDLAAIVGSATGLLTVMSFVPQAIRTWKTKHTKDLSRGTYIMLVLQSGGWLTYGVLLGHTPMIWTNAFVVLITMSILGAKLRLG